MGISAHSWRLTADSLLFPREHQVEVLPPHKNGAVAKGLNAKPFTKSPRKIKPIEEDEDFLDELEDSDAALDDDFDFEDNDLNDDE